MTAVDPSPLARKYLKEAAVGLQALGAAPSIQAFIATSDAPSQAYAKAAKAAFTRAGFRYQLRQVPRLQLEAAIRAANRAPETHGIFIYFPVFQGQQDHYLRNLVHYTKDLEAGSQYWTRKLFDNDRLAVSGDRRRKALLPCTPLAIVKLLTELGEYGAPGAQPPLAGKTITIFNRSEVVGRPLAMMLSNDGALVHSFDKLGPLQYREASASETAITRREALAQSDIIITGVPSPSFPPIQPEEIRKDAIAINFASHPNITDEAAAKARLFLPRVGPMTTAICMRNALRLYKNFHRPK